MLDCSKNVNKNKPICSKFNSDKRLRPILCYTGGKSKLADRIIKRIPPHKTYIEPFAGGASVFFAKPLAEKNVLNDLDKSISDFYTKFKKTNIKKCDMYPNKDRFDRLKNKKNLSPCEKLYVNKHSYGCMHTTYGVGSGTKRCLKTKDKTCKIGYVVDGLDEYKDKLKKSQIQNKDFRKIMEEYDSKNTFHYLDPPYVVGGESYKIHGVTPEDVCSTVKKMKGNVLLSYDNRPEVRKACKGLKMSKVSTKYTISKDNNQQKATELLISNY